MDQNTQSPALQAVDLFKQKPRPMDLNSQIVQEYNQYSLPQKNIGAVSQALAQLGDRSIAGQIGKAIQTPNYAGYCLKYVDDQTGNASRLPTAYADYQARQQTGQINASDRAPDKARVYFAPDQSNGQMGHVGLSNGDGTFTAATDNGVKTFSIKDWQNMTGQQFIGWAK